MSSWSRWRCGRSASAPWSAPMGSSARSTRSSSAPAFTSPICRSRPESEAGTDVRWPRPGRAAPQAYLGTTVAWFPNAFMMFGPNIGVASAFALIEAQLRYVTDALRTMRRQGLATVEVRPDVQAHFNEKVQRALRGTVWNAGGCSSYYLDANGRNSTVWPW